MILNAHSNYSLRYGTITTERLVELAVAHGHEAIAITDINNSSGVLEFAKLCKGHSVRPLAGMEFRNGDQLLYVVIARNVVGFREINDLCTARALDGLALPARPSFDHCYIIFPKDRAPMKLKDNEYIGITPEQIHRTRIEQTGTQTKYVAFPSVVFERREDFDVHRKLCAVGHNLLLSQLSTKQSATADSFFLSRSHIEELYADLPGALENTRRLIADCSFDFDFDAPKNKKTFTMSRSDDKALLEKLALDGLLFRYGRQNTVARERVLKELEIIDRLGFAAYFLIAWDTIQYTTSRGIYHVGRGSGANSVVAYCLRITDVCPIELDLYFERFLNPKRKVPPDFDIDFSWKDRDQVTDYIFKRYGKKHTALLGAIGTFKDRSIIREMGKVYGLPKSDIDRLIRYPHSPLNDNEICREILYTYAAIENYPNMRTIHSGGILISEEPITSYTALDLPPKGFPTAQFDMYLAEDIHLDKLDILSQRGLGHIQECAEIIARNRSEKVNIHDFERFKKDERIRAELKRANTIGCFYIESPATRGLLSKLKCDDYLTLVAASSIIRPGVASSGMMKAYIERFHNPTNFEYLHPIMEEQLKETFGVMVYQEDVLKVGHHFGGLDLADADVLRRMMSGKGRQQKQLREIQEKFFTHCRTQGYPEAITSEVWRQIASFAGYSFSKAHSASYAVESYQSLFLKTYYPLEFMVSVINNFGGFYSTRVYVDEARKSGGVIHLPCVNHSTYTTTLYGSDVYLGFVHLKSLEQKIGENIAIERSARGEFTSLDDFVHRLPISLDQLILLIRIDAFRFTGESKQQLLWQAHLLFNDSPPVDAQLFAVSSKSFTLPTLISNPIENAYDEIELLGFPVTMTYFDLLKTGFRGQCTAKELPNTIGKRIRMMGVYVTHKPIATKTGKAMAFGTFTDMNGDYFDTTNFPPCLARYPFTGVGVYLILGKVVEEFGFPSIEVEKMARMPIVADPRN